MTAMLESAIDYAIICIDTDGLVTAWNEGARRTMGWCEEEIVGQPASLFFTEKDRRNGILQCEMLAALGGGRGSDERWHLKKDGSVFWSNGEMMPLRTPDGAHLGFIKILRDRTQQQLAAAKQHADAELLRGVLAASTDCIKVLDLEARLIFMSEGGRKVMEVEDFETIRGCSWPDFWEGQGHIAAREAVEAARAGRVGHFRGLANTFTGNPRWWDVRVSPVLGQGGQPEKLLCVSRDITRAVRDEEQARLLGDELQHRVKNTLAMVQAIVRQTLRGAESTEAAMESIEMRLVALGRTQTMLTQDGWTTSDLQSVIHAALGPHDDGTERFRIAGPGIQLHAQAAMSLALVLHELATNAVKYGALSVPDGWVEIGWTVKADGGGDSQVKRLNLLWRERDGPPVRTPEKRGFGSRLIEQSLSGALKGTAVINYQHEGVTCRIVGTVEALSR